MNNNVIVHVPWKQTPQLFGIYNMFTLQRLSQDINFWVIFVLNG